MIWLRILWARLTGGVVVATRDHDGAVRYRVAWPDPWGCYASTAIGSGKITLHPDGKVTGRSYVRAWKQVWPRAALPQEPAP